MVTSYYRGHEIKRINGIWLYSDINKPVKLDKNRACGYCKQPQTKEGHDACLGTLENASNACCGHGKEDGAYIQFIGSPTIRGKEAINFLKYSRLKKDIIDFFIALWQGVIDFFIEREKKDDGTQR